MVAFLFILVILVVIIVVVNMNNKESRRQEMMKRAYLEEYKGHVRIYNESLELINKTKNIETLKSRVDVIKDQVENMQRIDNMGFKFGDRTSDEILDKITFFVNERIVEISESEYSDIIQKKDTYSSVKLAINALNKVQQKIIDNKNALLDCSIYNESREKIDSIIEKIKIDILLGQVKEIIEKAEKEKYKGHDQKAKDLYIDAVFLLKKSGYSDSNIINLQKEIESHIE